jgi:energy-coupling factor transporter ATP-binding protein EcfA2
MPIDIEKIKEGIEESFRISEPARGRDLVLVVGQTGSGKSTMVNYLLGYPFRRGRGGKAESLDSRAPAKMGDDAESITAYPAAYEGQDGFVYCDCPGFKDNRGDEQRVIVSVSTEAVVNKANSIRAIIAVVEWGTIETSRGEGLRDVTHTLGSLFNQGNDSSTVSNNNNPLNTDNQIKSESTFNLRESILFVITKTNVDIDHAYCMEKIEALLMAETKRLEEEKSKLNSMRTLLKEDQEDQLEKTIKPLIQKISILALLQQNRQNVILVNVCDQGETRQQILMRLRTLKHTPKGMMNFNAAETARGYFCTQITDEIVKALAFMKTFHELPDDTKKTEAKLTEKEKEAVECQNQLQDLNVGRDFKGEHDPIVVDNRSKITKNKKEFSLEQQQIDELTKTQKERGNELLKLDIADETEFYQKFFEGSRFEKILETASEVSEKVETPFVKISKTCLVIGFAMPVVWLVPFVAAAGLGLTTLTAGALRRRDTDFEYTGAPFIRVHETFDSGKIERSTYEPENGKYVAHYESGRTGKAKAEIIVIGEKRNKPEIKTKIQDLKDEIKILEEKKNEKIANVKTLMDTNEKLGEVVDEFLRSYDINLKETKQKVENLIKYTKIQIIAIKKELADKQSKIGECKTFFAKKVPFWNIIQELSNFIDFNNYFYPNISIQFKTLFKSCTDLNAAQDLQANRVIVEGINQLNLQAGIAESHSATFFSRSRAKTSSIQQDLSQIEINDMIKEAKSLVTLYQTNDQYDKAEELCVVLRQKDYNRLANLLYEAKAFTLQPQ